MARMTMPGHKWLLIDILNRGGVVHLRKIELSTRSWRLGYSQWLYFIAEQKNGALQLIGTDTRDIKKLISSGDLIPELSDKEFSIQLALGTVNCRVYNCKG